MGPLLWSFRYKTVCRSLRVPDSRMVRAYCCAAATAWLVAWQKHLCGRTVFIVVRGAAGGGGGAGVVC